MIRHGHSLGTLRIALALTVTSAAAGCGSGTGPESALELSVDGWIERGARVELTARRGGEVVAPGEASWSTEPAGALRITGPGEGAFTEAGSITLRAEAAGATGETTLQVAVPPDIVFDAVVDGNRDVYAAALDGRDRRRLTTHPGEDRDPAAAAGRVVFESYRQGGADLYEIPAAGADAEPLLASAADEIQPALASPAGRIAFARGEGGTFRIWTAAPDGSGAAQLTAESGGPELQASPAWAPGGDRVAFMSTRTGTADLYEAPAGGGEPAVLAGGPGPQVEPAWSPAGDGLAYVETVDGDAELFLMELPAERVVRLTERPGADGQPAFLPDGRIVYVAWSEDGQEAQLRWLDPAVPGQSQAVGLAVGDGTARNPYGVFP